MNYLNKLHCGDIVISNVGNIGYIDSIDYENGLFSWVKVYDRNGDVVPMNVDNVDVDYIPRWFTQIGAIKVLPEPLSKNKCADCDRDYDTDDRLDALNSNLLTLIDKLDRIINED